MNIPTYLIATICSLSLLIGCDQSKPTPQSQPAADTQPQTTSSDSKTTEPTEPSQPTEPTSARSPEPSPQDTPIAFDHSGTPEEQALGLARSFAQAANERFDLVPTIVKIQRGDVPPEHLQIIYTILSNTNESAIHQMRGETGNQVYLADDGREGVYDANGDLLQNGYNDGTFNYAHWQDEPLLHFSMDISPWIELGISEQDPTSVTERIYAYMGDLENGIIRTFRARPIPKLEENHQWNETGQVQTLAIFLLVIEAGDAQELFTMFEPEKQLSKEALISVLTKLNKGFDVIYDAQTDTP